MNSRYSSLIADQKALKMNRKTAVTTITTTEKKFSFGLAEAKGFLDADDLQFAFK